KPPTVEQPHTPERHVNIEQVTPAARETAIPVTISPTATSPAAEVSQPPGTEAANFCGWCGTVHAGGPEKCLTGPAVLKPAPKDQGKPSATQPPMPDWLIPVARDAKSSAP